MKHIFANAGWQVLEYLRRALTPFVINLLYGMTMLAVSAIGNDGIAIALTLLLLVATLFTDFIFMRAAGEIAYKMKLTGEAKRANRPVNAEKDLGTYRPSKEYAPYKGFVIGLVVALIPLILLLVGGLTDSTGCRTAVIFVAGWSYLPVFRFCALGKADDYIVPNDSLLWGLIILAVVLVVCGVAYIVGGRKEQRRRYLLELRSETIEEQKRAREEAIEAQRARAKAAAENRKGGRGGEKKR